MQFIRYQKDGAISYGLLEGEAIRPLAGDLFGEYTRGPRALTLGEVRLLTPCTPGKIIAVGNNFADRAREAGLPSPTLPLIFLKPPSALIGPDDAIVLPPQSQQVEHGAELAVVMGRRARWLSPEDAPRFILGYTCGNDVTARDIVEAEGLWTRGKSFDTFCPLGPLIQTALDPTEVLITCKVNGQTRQMTSTHDMLFSVPQLVAFISSVMTLLPGDVILMGTPAGAGPLVEGDVVEVEVEGVGVLKNTVTAESKRQ
jgi:2-keto-4-pentenoate hydratase/2-oxohepta-3-ene-1,7-dioic acid hydratase in catechol pathway